MIIRESAMSHAPTQNDPNWPPKSPHQALLSSPSGRKRWEQRRRDFDSSTNGSPRGGSRASQLLSDGVEGDTEEDEDEETLQLKLQAIEARLKLKKLQSKAKLTAEPEAEDSDGRRGIFSPRPRSNAAHGDKQKPTAHSRSQSEVQVPLSPGAGRKAPQTSTSPARVALGIDKGLRASDVSLKRPAVPKDTSVFARPALGARADRPSSFSGPSSSSRGVVIERPKSFSERLAQSRLKENERQAKEERIQNARSRGFSIDTIERTSSSQEHRTTSQQSNVSQSFSFERKPRPDALQRIRPPASTNTSFSSTASSSRPSSRQLPVSQPPALPNDLAPKKSSSFSDLPEATPDDSASFEPFSGIHLSRRLLPHNIVARALDQKELFPLPRLLSTVKGPEYEPPDVESDFVVLGVIASKSTPRNVKNIHKTASSTDPDDDDGPNRSKFMVLHLTDFKWEVDLFLFETAFTTFWKLTPGTLIAILNPGIMPPRDKRTGRFSLKLGSSEDTILEIGSARDLGFCKSIKKDGQECGTWIDKRKTEFCEFHVSLQIEKHKRGRMEVNTMVGMGKGHGKSNQFGGGGGGPSNRNREYDPFLHETMYVLPKDVSGRNAADRLDHDEGALNRGMSREELHRKRLAERERERDLAEKLGRIGGKAGAEYMRAKTGIRPGSSVLNTGRASAEGDKTDSRSSSATANRNTPVPGALDNPFQRSLDQPGPPDAAALGLLGKRAADVTLSPVKRRRTRTLGEGVRSSGAPSSSGAYTAEPMGWGGANKRDLLFSPSKKMVVGNRRIDDMMKKEQRGGTPQQQPPQLHPALSSTTQFGGKENGAERSAREASPTKKKARLMIEGKGIREPGRDSMGSAALPIRGALSSDDDDDLEIV